MSVVSINATPVTTVIDPLTNSSKISLTDMTSFYTRFLPTYFIYGEKMDEYVCNELEQEIEAFGMKIGADYAYVCKNKTGKYRPLTFAFYAEGGKFLARRTPNTLLAG